MSFKKIAISVAIGVFAVVALIVAYGMTGTNNLQNYQILQNLGGTVEVIDNPGIYNRNFGHVWTYPKNIQLHWNSHADDKSKEPDESIRVTFNDAGSANISTMIQFSLPIEKKQRILLHERFGGNLENIEHAVHAALTNAIKNSGPLMSASENQSSRKSEYTQAVEDQLRHGLYSMRRVQIELKDRLDDNKKPMKVDATEVVLDDKGIPIRTDKSPLEEYGITITQFSITGTDYDALTVQQFAAKQTAFLSAEKSKAQREQEIQQKSMIEAQGLRQVAEIEAAANQVKAKAVTEGQQKVETAEKAALEAAVLANQQLAVAKIEKDKAETAAAQAASVAKIKADQDAAVLTIAATANFTAAKTKADQDAAVLTINAEAQLLAAKKLADAKVEESRGLISIATAKQKEIELGGSVKESDRVLATIQADRDVAVALALSKIEVPKTIINGGGSAGGDGTMFSQMLNLTMLKQLGIVDISATQPAKK